MNQLKSDLVELCKKHGCFISIVQVGGVDTISVTKEDNSEILIICVGEKGVVEYA